jgi:Fic family protein
MFKYISQPKYYMGLRKKLVKGKEYYYFDLSYFIINKSKTFSKYIGAKKPLKKELKAIENDFQDEIIKRISNKLYTKELISKDDVIRSLLFKELFTKKYDSLTSVKKNKYDIESVDSFTLTTLTTEEVDVNRSDIENARKKNTSLTQREQISKNMLNAIASIKEKHLLDKQYFLDLHKTIMATFKDKNPGKIRNKNVHLFTQDGGHPLGRELSYVPPNFNKVNELLVEFIDWYFKSSLNPVEKAAMTHYKLYRLHPFLDGNKRMCRLLVNKTFFDESFPLLNISEEKEGYFDAIINAVENDNPKLLVEFTLKVYYAQVKKFVNS